jgi:hypothetical protein
MALWVLLSIFLTQGPIARTQSGVVTGVVRLPDGKAAVGVRVAALVAPDPGRNQGNGSELAAISQTDETGRYHLEDVPAGRYYIVAGRVDSPTYYRGVPGIAGASALSVTAGATLVDIDIVISAESSRAPSPAGIVWTLRNLNLDIRVTATGRIAIDANSIGAKMPEGITLTARQGAGPRVANELAVMNLGSSYSRQSSVAPDGTFTVTLQPGESTLSVEGLPEGYSVKSITSGSTDLRTHRLNVQTGMAEIVIVVIAGPRPGF